MKSAQSAEKKLTLSLALFRDNMELGSAYSALICIETLSLIWKYSML